MESEIPCDWIDRYNEGELDDVEKEMFQKQMLVNPLLRSEVYIDACLNRFLMDFEVQDLMQKIRSAAHRNARGNRLMDILLLIGSILCVATICGIFYLLRTNTETTPRYFLKNTNELHNNTKAESDNSIGPLPLQKATHQGLMEQNFESLAEFELLIGSGTRSGQFKLISPNVYVSVHAGTGIMFKWKNIDKKIPVSIVFLNNHGITMFEIPVDHSDSYLLKTNGFITGLYYWKIMADDKMVVMGKLTIL